MNSRERLQAALDHRPPDRVPVDFGATFVTGLHVSIVHKLRQRLLGGADGRVKVIEPYQMLGEIDDPLREALGIDVIGALARRSIFGTEAKDWKPFTTFDGTPCLIPGAMNLTRAPDGGWYMHPEGDTSVPPSGHMPEGGYFFDAVIRQDPIDEAKLDPTDNTEEFGPLSAEDLAYYRAKKAWFDERRQYGSILIVPGTAFGDIALVPAPWLKHPKGIRDVAEWYMITKTRPDFVRRIFDRQCEVALQNLETLIELFGDTIQVALITGTDFGTQRGPFISVRAYRELYQPYHRQINDLIHRRTGWKTFIHSCGSVYQFIPDFIEAGFDVLNPVQCSAADMEARRLKREFGRDLVFWGGGVDTQQTIARGTPDQVYGEVRERIAIFNEGGGYVFNAIHNIQGNTPIENVEAMFRALRDSARG
jgi:uroporphyrinogen-III decarboxylase